MPPPLLRLDSEICRGQVSSLDIGSDSVSVNENNKKQNERRDKNDTGKIKYDNDMSNDIKNGRDSDILSKQAHSINSLGNSFDISAAGTLRLGSNDNSVQYDISRQGLASRNRNRSRETIESSQENDEKNKTKSGHDETSNSTASASHQTSDSSSTANQTSSNAASRADTSDDDTVIGNVCAQDVMLMSILGTGASSVVMRGMNRRRHTIMAVKTVKVTDRERRQQLMSDLRALTRIGSRSGSRNGDRSTCGNGNGNGIVGLVSFHGAFYEMDTNRLSICLEHMDYGSLADVLRRLNRFNKSNSITASPTSKITTPGINKPIGFPEHVIRRIAQDVLLGLLHLHQHHVVHRDIKPPNILLNSNGMAKITDFGISAGLAHTQELCATWIGTVLYMSPERIESRGYSYSADIWSLGLTLMECASGRYPYGTSDGPLVLMLNVLDDPPPSLEGFDFSIGLKALLEGCLKKEPDQRMSAADLLALDFVNNDNESQKRNEKEKGEKIENDRFLLRSFLLENIPCEDNVDSIGELLAAHTYRAMTGVLDDEDDYSVREESDNQDSERSLEKRAGGYDKHSYVYSFLRQSSTVTIKTAEAGKDFNSIDLAEVNSRVTLRENVTVKVLAGIDEIVSQIQLIRDLRFESLFKGSPNGSSHSHGNNTIAKGHLHMKVSRVIQNEIGSFDIQVMGGEVIDDSKNTTAIDDSNDSKKTDDKNATEMTSEGGIESSKVESLPKTKIMSSSYSEGDCGSDNRCNSTDSRGPSKGDTPRKGRFIDRICLCRDNEDPNSYWLKSMTLLTIKQ